MVKEKPKGKEKTKSKEKPKSKEQSLSCSGLKIEEGLLFCPQFTMAVRIDAMVCKTCNWNDKTTEEKLYKEFMGKLKK